MKNTSPEIESLQPLSGPGESHWSPLQSYKVSKCRPGQTFPGCSWRCLEMNGRCCDCLRSTLCQSRRLFTSSAFQTRARQYVQTVIGGD